MIKKLIYKLKFNEQIKDELEWDILKIKQILIKSLFNKYQNKFNDILNNYDFFFNNVTFAKYEDNKLITISDEQVVNDFVNLYPEKHFDKNLKLKYYKFDNPNYDELNLFWNYVKDQKLLTYDEIFVDFEDIINDNELHSYHFIKENSNIFKNNISDIKKYWMDNIYFLYEITKQYKPLLNKGRN